MTITQKKNESKVGDPVVFAPNEHAVGWAWSTFERVRLRPGDTGVVTRIERDEYLYLNENRGGFHWECFKRGF